MLREIYCEEFYQKRVEFNDDFNVVLGTNSGDNSIGKSTFIIDFVFGGNSYSESTDILDNIGSHNIYFKFEFFGKFYYFSRCNTNRNEVWKCDQNYNEQEAISNESYCKWLSKQYELDFFKLTFRDVVGRYIRAYGKNNCDEKHPLHVTQQETANAASIAILKLFDRYQVISELEDCTNESQKELAAFKKAQAYNFVDKISKRGYIKNQKEIEILSKELNRLIEGLDYGLLDIDSSASEEAIEVKKQLSRAKRLRSGILSKITTLDENLDYKFSCTTETYTELEKFFPNVNLKHIDEVEVFHKKVASIYKKELQEEKRMLNKQLIEYNVIINELESKLKNLIQNPNLSKIILQKHADILKLIDKMNNENEAYIKLEELKKIKKDNEESLQNAKNEQFGIIEKAINIEMDRINSKLYTEKYNSPIVHFTNSQYSFTTPNDTGTGIAYKGLIVFDLAIMHLTKLPVLVHDSVVLKQISDDAIENIIKQYIECKKQVIIALDKQDSYSEKTSSMLDKYSILKLAPNGQELFGRSWGKNADE